MPFFSSGGSSIPTLAAGAVSLTSGDLTTASGTFVDATGLTVTISTGARRCLVSFVAQVTNTTAGSGVAVDIAVDGTRVGGTNGLMIYVPNTGARVQSVSASVLTSVLTAASHTFKIQWLVGGNTGTMTATATSPAVLSVAELLITS